MTLTRTAGAALLPLLLAGCVSGGHPTPDAIYRHPVTGEIGWCQKGEAVGMVLGGAIAGASQGADYATCKTAWESKGYTRLDASAKLSPEDQQRYEAELERMNQARADSIRKK